MATALSGRDRTSALTATCVAFVLIAQQVAAKATRDALFLSQFPAEDLPVVMAGAALVSVIAVLGMSRLLARRTPAQAVPVVLLGNGLLFAGEWMLSRGQPAATGVVVYLHTAALGGVVVSGFWSVINERFDPHAARAAVSRIATGATIGGVIGGVVAWQVSSFLGITSLLLVLAAANVIAGLGLRAVTPGGAKLSAIAPAELRGPSGLSIIGQTPYLKLLAALVALSALAGTSIDYVFKASVAASYQDGAELAAFFAIFHTAVALATFGVQTLLTRRWLQRFGLAGTTAMLPLVFLVGGVAAFAVPLMWILTALRGAAQSVENSFFRSAYELCYTPLAPEKKRPTKTIVDVGSEKLAVACGSGIAILLVTFVPLSAVRVLVGLAIGAAVLALFLSEFLHRGYVDALASSLRSGAIELDHEQIIDATTRQTLADTMALDRRTLLKQIDALHPQAAGASAALGSRSEDGTRDLQGTDGVLAASRDGDAKVLRAVLGAGGSLEPEQVSAAVELLAQDAVLRDVVHLLRASAEVATDALIAALADADVGGRVRRRIPRVLRSIPTQPVVDSLIGALADPVFEVRYRAAVALLHMTAQNPVLNVSQEQAFDAVRREMALGPQTWNAYTLTDQHGDQRSAFDDEKVAAKVGRSLTYVFVVLALVLDREATNLAFCALASDNTSLRGTGLEYLDSVLPNDLREALAPHFSDRRVTKRAARPRQQIVDELLQSRDTLAIDRKLLLQMIKPPE